MTGLIGLNPLKRIEESLKFEPVLTGFNQLALEFIPRCCRAKPIGFWASLMPRLGINSKAISENLLKQVERINLKLFSPF
jgi:hypothetical protein